MLVIQIEHMLADNCCYTETCDVTVPPNLASLEKRYDDGDCDVDLSPNYIQESGNIELEIAHTCMFSTLSADQKQFATLFVQTMNVETQALFFLKGTQVWESRTYCNF